MNQAQRQLAACFAAAMLPAGRLLPAAGADVVARAEQMLDSPVAARALGRMLSVLDRVALLRTGRRFSRLSEQDREQLLSAWETDPVVRWPMFALGTLLRSAHYDRREYYRALGAEPVRSSAPEPRRWLAQVRRGDDLDADESIECDVVVVGTGAGGAVAGRELAARGLAVVFLEEGELRGREQFTGRSWDAYRRFYRSDENLIAIGNTVIPIMVGRLVGGSTALNGGTCRRGVAAALDGWAETVGDGELSAAGLAPYYERVERELGVTTTRPAYLGALPGLVARGCDALGWRHSLVPRNAPDCDGQGVCTFGCPTDAKRSTNVSYIPSALQRGALLFTRTRARRVLLEGGRAAGIEAVALGSGRSVTVRARAVVLACGALHSPSFLLDQGLCNASGQVGRHLKLHPTTMISARFGERLAAYAAVPQAVSCDELTGEGILLYGASAPPDAGALNFAFSGRRLVDVMDDYDRIATLTLIVIDESEGRVRRLPGGRRLISYRLGQRDAERIHRGLVAAADILHAAGAERIYPLSPRVPELEDGRALERYRGLRPAAGDAVLTSVHPLGTCRMSRNPRDGVVGLDHQTHDLPGLWIVDASAMPTTPGMNPQLTVMAMAARAADKIRGTLEAS